MKYRIETDKYKNTKIDINIQNKWTNEEEEETSGGWAVSSSEQFHCVWTFSLWDFWSTLNSTQLNSIKLSEEW